MVFIMSTQEFIFTNSANCLFHMVHYTHDYTYTCTHSQTDTSALFLQDPADAAETVELVSLVNKQ